MIASTDVCVQICSDEADVGIGRHGNKF
jgi:hypothetical protein